MFVCPMKVVVVVKSPTVPQVESDFCEIREVDLEGGNGNGKKGGITLTCVQS